MIPYHSPAIQGPQPNLGFRQGGVARPARERDRLLISHPLGGFLQTEVFSCPVIPIYLNPPIGKRKDWKFWKPQTFFVQNAEMENPHFMFTILIMVKAGSLGNMKIVSFKFFARNVIKKYR